MFDYALSRGDPGTSRDALLNFRINHGGTPALSIRFFKRERQPNAGFGTGSCIACPYATFDFEP